MLGWLPKQTIAVTMTIFRRLFFCCLLLPAIAIAQCRTAAAQGHFCARYDDDATPEDCSFTSFEMCQQSISGLGGMCTSAADSPAPPPPPLFQFPMPSALPPAPVPPPPDLSVPAPPTQLPDAPQSNGY
jgi:hypothetical protein